MSWCNLTTEIQLPDGRITTLAQLEIEGAVEYVATSCYASSPTSMPRIAYLAMLPSGCVEISPTLYERRTGRRSHIADWVREAAGLPLTHKQNVSSL
jgi:hypothetical protein